MAEARLRSRFGLLRQGHSPFRPPWASESRIRDRCTACGDCIRRCEEKILSAGPAGTPVVSFERSGCTFCGACAEDCPEAVFSDTSAAAWHLKAEIQSSCLLNFGITCQSCTDACGEQALVFDIRQGGVGRLRMHEDVCTGCGQCVSACPGHAISMKSIEVRSA